MVGSSNFVACKRHTKCQHSCETCPVPNLGKLLGTQQRWAWEEEHRAQHHRVTRSTSMLLLCTADAPFLFRSQRTVPRATLLGAHAPSAMLAALCRQRSGSPRETAPTSMISAATSARVGPWRRLTFRHGHHRLISEIHVLQSQDTNDVQSCEVFFPSPVRHC